MKFDIYKILNSPLIYKIVQSTLAVGVEKNLTSEINNLLKQLPKSKKILDIGCGPASWLFKSGLKPVGIDVSKSYLKQYRKNGATGILGSAEKLPFEGGSFDAIWSIWLFHHLSDEIAKKSILEMLRVCKKSGYILIIDAVMPVYNLSRPLAYIIRKLDRGRYVRNFNQNVNLLPNPSEWTIKRKTYSHTGLEMMVFKFIKK